MIRKYKIKNSASHFVRHSVSFFQNDEVLVQFDELDRTIHT